MYRYFPSYLDSKDSDRLLRRLIDQVSWRQETVRMFGVEHRVPRLLGWYGEAGVDYVYAGNSHPASGWQPELLALAVRLEREFDQAFNFVLLNRYRTGLDAMGWHRDDEAGLGDLVASISLGASRRFSLEHDGERESLILAHGSLLLMDGSIRHTLPRTRHAVGERVNLSYRLLDANGLGNGNATIANKGNNERWVS